MKTINKKKPTSNYCIFSKFTKKKKRKSQTQPDDSCGSSSGEVAEAMTVSCRTVSVWGTNHLCFKKTLFPPFVFNSILACVCVCVCQPKYKFQCCFSFWQFHSLTGLFLTDCDWMRHKWETVNMMDARCDTLTQTPPARCSNYTQKYCRVVFWDKL